MMFTNKQAIKVFFVLVITFVALVSMHVAAKYELSSMEANDKQILKSLLAEKSDKGFDDYEALKIVMDENPDIIIQMGESKNKRLLIVSGVELVISVIFLYLASVFISGYIRK